MNKDYVCLGKVINVRGLKGELKLFSFTDFPKDRFKKGNKIYFANNKEIKEFKVSSFSLVANFIYLKVEEINDIDTANLYREYDVLFKKEELKTLEENNYYYSDLIDSNVYIEDELIGIVKAIENNGANYNLRITSDSKELLFPFIKSFLLDVDISNKIIKYRNIEGLK